MITAVVLAIFLHALLVCARANDQIAQSGVPAGRVILQDTGPYRESARPLVSRRFGLIGKPDYLVETSGGPVPVEIKSRGCPPAGPNTGDVTQLMAYCLVIEDTFKRRPTHGILAYLDRSQQIPCSPEARDHVLAILDDIREADDGRKLGHNHSQRARCQRCGYRVVCDEAL